MAFFKHPALPFWRRNVCVKCPKFQRFSNVLNTWTLAAGSMIACMTVHMPCLSCRCQGWAQAVWPLPQVRSGSGHVCHRGQAFWQMDLWGCDAVGLEFGGLHRREGNCSAVPSSHPGPIPDAALPKGFVPDRGASGVLHDDARPQQRQEAYGSAHCEARLRNHPFADWQEPHPGVCGCCQEWRSSRRLHP